MRYAHLNGVPLVYFIHSETPETLIKIGASESFGIRFDNLSSACPCRLTVLGVHVVPDKPTTLERRLHKRFEAHRDHGEWFHPAETILAYIQSHTTLPGNVPPPKYEFSEVSVDEMLQQFQLPTLMTVKELADFWKVSTVTVRRHVKQRKIPFVRVGDQLRFDTREFITDAQRARDAMIESKYAKHVAETAAIAATEVKL